MSQGPRPGVGGAGRGPTLPEFVGRERELAALTGPLARPPAVVLVEGEAGIGKSRLLQAFLSSAVAERSRILVVGCPPFRESLTLGPIVDAVCQAREGVTGLALSPLAGALRPLLPEWAADLPPAPEPLDDANASRHRLFRALAELIQGLGVEVLVVEDLHWADEATLEFLLFLTSRPGARSPSLVATYRPEDVADGSLVLQLSSRLPAGATHARVTVPPLDKTETARLVSSMLDCEDVSEEFTIFLHARTDGIPLAIEESVRLLVERADLVRRDGRWMRHSLDELEVPPTVRDAVLERLQRLDPVARRVLEVAAVLAEPADEMVIREPAGLRSDKVQAGLHQALSCGLLVEDERGRYRFRHALMGQAVYEAIPGPQRRRLHLLAGRALERLDPTPDVQLARHFREGGDHARWGQYAERAAARAIDKEDHTTAVVLLHELVTTAGLPIDTRARLARTLGDAALARREMPDGLHRQVIDTLRAVLDTQGLDARERAEVRTAMARLLGQVGDMEACRTELERAIAHLDHDVVQQCRAMTYLGLPYLGPWPASTYLRWLRRAADVARGITSAEDRLALATDRAFALLILGEEAGWKLAAELPASATSPGDRRELARGHAHIGATAVLWGRYAEARQRLVAGFELVESDGFLRIRNSMLVTLAHLDWLTGVWEGLAERVAAVGDADDTHPVTRLHAVRIAGRLEAARGSPHRAEDYLRRALDEARKAKMADEPLEPAAALARLRLAEGAVEEALRETDEAVSILATKRVWLWATEIAPVRVEALVRADRGEEAAGLVAAFGRGLRGRNAPAPRAALATCRAILVSDSGDARRAAAAFGRAARAWDALPQPYDALLARERQAHCLLADDRVADGLSLLTDVHRGMTELGARGDADRVAHTLRGRGVEVTRRSGGRPGYGDELSPRERDVVRLLVTGKTDREIAAKLFISPKTVARHLHSARRKLKVSSRTALAVAVIESGLVDDAAPVHAP